MSTTCSHQWRPLGGCLQCTSTHTVAPYIEAGNHRALEPGCVYQCRCGAALHIPDEAEDLVEACVYCGEPDCDNSCTGAIMARRTRHA